LLKANAKEQLNFKPRVSTTTKMHRDWQIKVQAAFYFNKEIMNHTSN
jgi:hypothetical protein